jgi:hypothetical protein
MSKQSRSILGKSLDNGRPAPATTPSSDPTSKLRTSDREVKTTPPAPTDQSSTQVEPRRSPADKIGKIGADATVRGLHSDGLHQRRERRRLAS